MSRNEGVEVRGRVSLATLVVAAVAAGCLEAGDVRIDRFDAARVDVPADASDLDASDLDAVVREAGLDDLGREAGSGDAIPCDPSRLDLAGDPLNCGDCGRACRAGEACCQGECRALDTVDDCGACGLACGPTADGCDLAAGGAPCRCGADPACVAGLLCLGGECRCARDSDCPGGKPCCGGRCRPDLQACPDAGVADCAHLEGPCFDGPLEAAQVGACRMGLRRCVDGVLTACEGQVLPTAEVCDGLNNDCDGEVDEDSDVSCYDLPTGAPGVGVCRSGVRACLDGVLGACEGQVGPDPEICDGLDNDCDGRVDGYNEICYTGQPETLGVGPCRTGMWSCHLGVFSACVGQIVPAPEQCNRVDDDCDGLVDEDFDLTADPANCGACGNRCGPGQGCCGRVCVDLGSTAHCGGCDDACGAGADQCAAPDGAYACRCGDGPACPGPVRCAAGRCVCERDDDCGPDMLCCDGTCEPTDPAAQCAACGDGGCDPLLADGCEDRACVCGDSGAACQEGTVCGESVEGFRCLGCGDNGDCAPGTLCCDNACAPLGPPQCEGCQQPCNVAAADRCLDTGAGAARTGVCSCGPAAQACAGANPYCVGERCHECRDDADCPAGRGQCVPDAGGVNVCRGCDPRDHAGCVADQLCCGDFVCQATSPDTQCDACGVACGADTDTCMNRVCRCGVNPACIGANPVCLGGACRRCDEHGQCGANELCCNNNCVVTGGGPGQQCTGCGVQCNQASTSLCENRTCMCGGGPPCGGDAPVCDDARGQCVQCMVSADCPNGGQCVDSVCRACNPANHAGCGADEICCDFACQSTGSGAAESCTACGVACAQDTTSTCWDRTCRCGNSAPCSGATPYCNDATGACQACVVDAHCPAGAPQCVSGVCRLCDPADHAGCVAEGLNPVCDATFTCRGCVADAECATNPLGPRCNVPPGSGRCRSCDTLTDEPCENPAPICNEALNRCQACASDQECVERPGSEDQCVGGSCRLCDPADHAGCDRAGGTSFCDPGAFTCRACANDGECAGNPNGGQCVAGVCRPCDPADHGGCAANQLCCGNFECQATAPGAGQQCTACGVACNQTTTSSCTDRTCQCGMNAPCGGATPVCDDARGVCLECVVDADCSNGGQCDRGVCVPPGWRLIEPGEFWMGSPPDEPARTADREERHLVRITRPFLLQATEVTQGQWRAVAQREGWGESPSRFAACGDDCPVERVSWYEAVAYANALSRAEGLPECYGLANCVGQLGGGCAAALTSCAGDYVCGVAFVGLDCRGYRLPTEAEWEYAARAGTEGAIYNEDDPFVIVGTNNAPALHPIAWYGGNSGVEYANGFDCSGWHQKQFPSNWCGTHPVAQKRPNAWGLYDMLGNVWEWTNDWYAADYGGFGDAAVAVVDPLGPAAAPFRVYRGGGWVYGAGSVRAAHRYGAPPGRRPGDLGFRLARSVEP